MTGHTKLPWSVSRSELANTDGAFTTKILGATGATIALCKAANGHKQANADFIVRAANNHEALLKAAKVYLATNPVFRLKPLGGEGSEARLRQRDQIEAEDALIKAIQEAERQP